MPNPISDLFMKLIRIILNPHQIFVIFIIYFPFLNMNRTILIIFY